MKSRIFLCLSIIAATMFVSLPMMADDTPPNFTTTKLEIPVKAFDQATPIVSATGDTSYVITVQVPTKIDTSKPEKATEGVQLLASLVLTLVVGFFAKKFKWVGLFLNTTRQRVLVSGLIATVFVGFKFGFSADVISLIWQSILGILSAMSIYAIASGDSNKTTTAALPTE